MALKATIFKALLQVADMDSHHYADHTLTLARHPSETDERMMVRLLAFALHANDALQFGNGLSTDDEPDLWQKDLTGAIELWVDVGLPDEREVRKACGRAAQVVVYLYGTGAGIWWQQNHARLTALRNLAVLQLPVDATRSLAALAARSMKLQCSIQDGEALVADGESSVRVQPEVLMSGVGATAQRG